MIMPTIPHTSNAKMINKTIVYSDTIIPLKDIGDNIKIKSISNVSQFSLESCLNTIFKSNPNVVFHTVQYSENNKKVYFYTDKVISINAWCKKNRKIRHKPLSSPKEILTEIQNVLVANTNEDSDCISLYDVALLMKYVRQKLESTKNNYKTLIEEKLNSKFENSSLKIYDFDFEINELSIKFKNYESCKIFFKKKDGNLYISKSESKYYNNIVFQELYSDLITLYNKLLEFYPFKTEGNWGIFPVNSKFRVNISELGVYIIDSRKFFDANFVLSSDSYLDIYDSRGCNSLSFIEAINGNEDKIFKKIFIKIDDCPRWSRPILYETRQKQLAEKQRIEEEKGLQEKKLQKRLELKSKIFPFSKK